MRLGGYVRDRRPTAAQSLRQKVYIVIAIIAAHFGVLQVFAMFSDAQAVEMIEHVEYYEISAFDDEGNPLLVEEPEVESVDAAEPAEGAAAPEDPDLEP